MDMNSGYSGWSMSKRAVEAYEAGEMPRSKWTKWAMVREIMGFCREEWLALTEDVTKWKKDEIFCELFTYSSWHHTSKFCNPTYFYSIDDAAMQDYTRPMTEEEIEQAEAIVAKSREQKRAFEDARKKYWEQIEANAADRKSHEEEYQRIEDEAIASRAAAISDVKLEANEEAPGIDLTKANITGYSDGYRLCNELTDCFGTKDSEKLLSIGAGLNWSDAHGLKEDLESLLPGAEATCKKSKSGKTIYATVTYGEEVVLDVSKSTRWLGDHSRAIRDIDEYIYEQLKARWGDFDRVMRETVASWPSGYVVAVHPSYSEVVTISEEWPVTIDAFDKKKSPDEIAAVAREAICDTTEYEKTKKNTI
jgi:hypothetical protein